MKAKILYNFHQSRVAKLVAVSDFFSGFVVSADDGTSLEVRWNSLAQGYQVDIKGSAGERLSVGGGFASLFSADSKASVQVTNGQVLINADSVVVNGNISTQIDGGVVCVGLNGLPGVPGVNSCGRHMLKILVFKQIICFGDSCFIKLHVLF